MSSETQMRDIAFLLADKGMEQVIKGFLNRDQFHQSLGCGRFDFDPRKDIIVSPTKDPGMFRDAVGLLQIYEKSHARAVLVVDADWKGSPGAPAIKKKLEKILSPRWEKFAVIVIEPELEAWIMNDNPHVATTFRCPKDYRKILEAAEWWPADAAKPPRPKEALEHLKRNHGARAVNADFGKLAAKMTVRNCKDPAFLQLRDQLRAWFPEQP